MACDKLKDAEKKDLQNCKPFLFQLKGAVALIGGDDGIRKERSDTNSEQLCCERHVISRSHHRNTQATSKKGEKKKQTKKMFASFFCDHQTQSPSLAR